MEMGLLLLHHGFNSFSPSCRPFPKRVSTIIIYIYIHAKGDSITRDSDAHISTPRSSGPKLKGNISSNIFTLTFSPVLFNMTIGMSLLNSLMTCLQTPQGARGSSVSPEMAMSLNLRFPWFYWLVICAKVSAWTANDTRR